MLNSTLVLFLSCYIWLFIARLFSLLLMRKFHWIYLLIDPLIIIILTGFWINIVGGILVLIWIDEYEQFLLTIPIVIILYALYSLIKWNFLEKHSKSLHPEIYPIIELFNYILWFALGIMISTFLENIFL